MSGSPNPFLEWAKRDLTVREAFMFGAGWFFAGAIGAGLEAWPVWGVGAVITVFAIVTATVQIDTAEKEKTA